MATLEQYVLFNHGENPLDVTSAPFTNYKDASRHRAPGQGIAALVYEYSETEIVDESYALTGDTESLDPIPAK